MTPSARNSGVYACRLYAHKRETGRFLLVCEAQAFPATNRATEWNLVILGFDPPNRVKPWLKLNGHHQIWLDAAEAPDGSRGELY